MSYQYAYLFGNLFILFPVWFLLYLHRRDLRVDILIMSLVFGICGPLSELWYLQDYWQPQTITGTSIGIEDFLFGFFIGGIISVLYLEIFNKHISKKRTRNHPTRFFFLFITLIILFVSFYVFGLNSIYASVITFLALAIFIYHKRRDLFVDQLMSGIFLAGMMFLFYLVFLYIFPDAINRWWFLKNISGVLILGIPVEELLWAFSFGLVGGPIYEFINGFRILKTR